MSDQPIDLADLRAVAVAAIEAGADRPGTYWGPLSAAMDPLAPTVLALLDRLAAAEAEADRQKVQHGECHHTFEKAKERIDELSAGNVRLHVEWHKTEVALREQVADLTAEREAAVPGICPSCDAEVRCAECGQEFVAGSLPWSRGPREWNALSALVKSKHERAEAAEAALARVSALVGPDHVVSMNLLRQALYVTAPAPLDAREGEEA